MPSINQFLALAVLLAPVPAFAHNGLTLEQSSGAYFTDLGYDLPLRQGDESVFELSLFHVKAGKTAGEIDFTDATLSLLSGSIIEKAGTATKPEFGETLLPLRPKKSGHWVLLAEFRDHEKTITVTKFPVEIIPKDEYGDNAGSSVWMRALFVGYGLGLLVLAYGAFRKRT